MTFGIVVTWFAVAAILIPTIIYIARPKSHAFDDLIRECLREFDRELEQRTSLSPFARERLIAAVRLRLTVRRTLRRREW